MSLYRKHRPQEWDQIYGNEELVSSLQNLLEKKARPHTYLFVGPTGCGKTTIARILAKALGCEDADYKEVNAANFNGVDTIREINQQARFKPLKGSCKVWNIDECHMLSKAAQNAFLKMLEDTPDHVYFILATTDPQKLLPTVKNRATEYRVEELSDTQMKKLIVRTAKKEDESLEKAIVEQIIMDAQGHARAALTVLEKVLSVEPEMRLETAKKTAETEREAIELCRLLIAGGSWKKGQAILKGLKGQDAEGIRRMILGYSQSVLLNKDDVRAALVIEQFMEPLYDVGFPGLVCNCYLILKG